MADEAEQSEEKAALLLQASIDALRLRAAKDNVPAIKGDCEVCEDPSLRLVRSEHSKHGMVWACASCRDRYKMKDWRPQ